MTLQVFSVNYRLRGTIQCRINKQQLFILPYFSVCLFVQVYDIFQILFTVSCKLFREIKGALLTVSLCCRRQPNIRYQVVEILILAQVCEIMGVTEYGSIRPQWVCWFGTQNHTQTFITCLETMPFIIIVFCGISSSRKFTILPKLMP